MKNKLFSRVLVSLLVLGALISFGGCDQILENLGLTEIFPTYDEQVDTAEDLALLLADIQEGMLEIWVNDLPAPAPLPAPSGLNRILSVCRDTAFVIGDLTYLFDRTFSTKDSIAHEEYDSTRSVWVDRRIVIKGDREYSTRKVNIDHVGVVVVDSIAPKYTEQSYGGWGHREVKSSFKSKYRSVWRNYNAQHQWAYQKIPFHRDRASSPYPISGKLDIHTVVHRISGTKTTDLLVTSVITFDGTRYAKMLVQNELEYWIDMENGISYDKQP